MKTDYLTRFPPLDVNFERVRRDAARERHQAISTLMRSIFGRMR